MCPKENKDSIIEVTVSGNVLLIQVIFKPPSVSQSHLSKSLGAKVGLKRPSAGLVQSKNRK